MSKTFLPVSSSASLLARVPLRCLSRIKTVKGECGVLSDCDIFCGCLACDVLMSNGQDIPGREFAAFTRYFSSLYLFFCGQWDCLCGRGKRWFWLGWNYHLVRYETSCLFHIFGYIGRFISLLLWGVWS